jgi:hypothetical protein
MNVWKVSCLIPDGKKSLESPKRRRKSDIKTDFMEIDRDGRGYVENNAIVWNIVVT